MPPTNGDDARAVRGAIRSGIADAWGTDRVPEAVDRFRPHVSVAYGSASQDAAPIIEALRGASTEPAHLSVSSASLIVIHRDRRVHEWETVEQVPIGKR